MLKILKKLHKLQDSSAIKVLIADDTVEGKTGKYIEGSRDALWSNKVKRNIRGINVVSLNCSDGYSNFMIDFAISMGNYARVKFNEFTQEVDTRSITYKRRLEIMKGKSQNSYRYGYKSSKKRYLCRLLACRQLILQTSIS